MPEGPSIVILRDEAAKFRGKTVRCVGGDSKLDLGRMLGRRVVSIRSWGKHFLMEFGDFSLRVHLLMFGSYRIDDPKPASPGVSFEFDNGSLSFHAASLKYVEGALDDAYDWRADVMNPDWDPALACRKIEARPDELVCDVLLDQDIFGGVGNIIKNEVLFRTRTSPFTQVGELSPAALGRIADDARAFSFRFLELRRRAVLRKHLEIYGRSTCPSCGDKVLRKVHGERGRRSFFCPVCQHVSAPRRITTRQSEAATAGRHTRRAR